MSIPHAAPGIPVDLHTRDESLTEARTRALVKNESFEAIRLVVSKDDQVCHNHHVSGPITVQCLEGWIALTIDGDEHSLRAGQWTYVPAEVPHNIAGIEDSLVLLTVIFG